jgi:hypothetical protein
MEPIVSRTAIGGLPTMPHPKKKQRLEEGQSIDNIIAVADHNNLASSFDDLGTDELAHILGFLPPIDIMLARLNNKMREAAKKTIVPMTDFEVNKLVEYNAMDLPEKAH